MDVRMKIAVSSPSINVAAFCREHEISRETFYFWKRRYAAEGIDGLSARSRAPRSSPHRVSAALEDEIIELRKELDDLGVDSGPATIQWHLGRRSAHRRAVPSVATIWRVLVRRGFVVPDPRKRPNASYHRFEASAPNELWQTDYIEWTIATGIVRILSFLDDHSRVALRVRAIEHATTEVTWETFCQAAALWGLPLGQLSDNGLNYSGKLRNIEVHFEIQLRHAGVVPKTSRPYHPQTCGKVERFQQTLKKWLRRKPLATNLVELQQQLDEFVDYYNHHRPHSAIGRITPAERWATTPPAINLGIALPSPARQTTTTVQPSGIVRAGGSYRIHVGRRWAGHTARIHSDANHAAVFIDHQLVRAISVEPGRDYYGLPRTRP